MTGPASPAPTGHTRADAVVIGNGIVALAVSRALVQQGLTVTMVGRTLPGAASWAAPGLLAPSLGAGTPPDVRALYAMALERYAARLAELADETGEPLTLDTGLIELDPNDSVWMRAPAARVLSQRELGEMEPALAVTTGTASILHEANGWLDPALVLDALAIALDRSGRASRIEALATRVLFLADGVIVSDDVGGEHHAENVVLANGAWAGARGSVDGLPRELPIRPLRGQVLQFGARPLAHAVAMPAGYLIPRGETTLVGSTTENAGFDDSTTPEAIERLRAVAIATVPALREAPVLGRWAGLRPCTPDFTPAVGRDREQDRLVYALGHSRNGILLPFETGVYVAGLVTNGSDLPDAELWHAADPERLFTDYRAATE